MAKKTTAATAEASAPQVSAVFENGVLAVAITLNGESVDGEVRLWPNTPFRPTVGGRLAMQYRDPRLFALTVARYDRPASFSVVSRVIIDETEYLTDPIEVSID